MPSCLVCNRARTPTTKLQKITFHTFPSNLVVREKWNDFIKENGLDNKTRRKLPKTAVPSIIISKVKNAKCMFPEQKVGLATTTISNINMTKSLVKLSSSKNDVELSPLDLSRPKISFPNSYDIKNRSIQISAKNIACEEGVSVLADNSVQLNLTCENSTVLNDMNKSLLDVSAEDASKSVPTEDASKRVSLELEIGKLSERVTAMTKKYKLLQQTLRRKKKKIESLKALILEMKKENDKPSL